MVHIDRWWIHRDNLHEHADGAVDSCAVSARVCSVDRETHSYPLFFSLSLRLVATLTHAWLDRDIISIRVELAICLETSDDVFAIAVGTAVTGTDSDGDE